MPRDYARTSRRRARESKRGLWITVLILIILFAAALFYLKHHSSVPVKTVTPTKETHKKSKVHQQGANNNSTQQSFDFYTLLPKNQTASQGNNQPGTKDAINRVSTKNLMYAVQVGEFQGYAAADELKAKVVLQGYEATITPVKKDNATLYKVWLGPFATREQALRQQKDLTANQIKSVIITLKKN